MKRFGRSEVDSSGRIVWCVYESPFEGDYKGGRLLASFIEREHALAFMQLADPKEGT